LSFAVTPLSPNFRLGHGWFEFAASLLNVSRTHDDSFDRRQFEACMAICVGGYEFVRVVWLNSQT
jgi:hypothetical protein